jgi:hypothetical protein
VFVVAVFALGVITKCYRDAHPSAALPQSAPGKARPTAFTGATAGRPGASFITPARKRMLKRRGTSDLKLSDPVFEHE